MSGTIVEHLRGKKRVCVDSVTIVYFIERHPTYIGVVRPLFELVDSGELTGLSSHIALLEVLVKPLQQGRGDLVRLYREILVDSRSFSLFPVDREVAERGAEIRATYQFKTFDSIQLATAITRGAELFVTNDVELKRFDGVEVLLLKDFLTRSSTSEVER